MLPPQGCGCEGSAVLKEVAERPMSSAYVSGAARVGTLRHCFSDHVRSQIRSAASVTVPR